MIENKKELIRKENDQNDFRAMFEKSAKASNKKKSKKIELGVDPEEIVKQRQQLKDHEEKIKPEYKLNPYGAKVLVNKGQPV